MVTISFGGVAVSFGDLDESLFGGVVVSIGGVVALLSLHFSIQILISGGNLGPYIGPKFFWGRPVGVPLASVFFPS